MILRWSTTWTWPVAERTTVTRHLSVRWPWCYSHVIYISAVCTDVFSPHGFSRSTRLSSLKQLKSSVMFDYDWFDIVCDYWSVVFAWFHKYRPTDALSRLLGTECQINILCVWTYVYYKCIHYCFRKRTVLWL